MKQKESLVLMELLIMVLVFSMAAACCLRIFFWSEQTSRTLELETEALRQVQNAAETVKACSGDFQEAAEYAGGTAGEESLTIYFDGNWAETEAAGAVYTLTVAVKESGNPLLGCARAAVETEAKEVLAELNVCWQEVL